MINTRRLKTVNRNIGKHAAILLIGIILSSALTAFGIDQQQSANKDLPLPGESFLCEKHVSFIIPSLLGAAKQKPWVWYAPTLPGLPGKEERWMFQRFVSTGISIAGIDVGESYGSPAGQGLFTAFYNEMLTRGYSSKPVLLGRSRGGLMALAWAVKNPEKVGGFAGIYPVCNLASYPGIEKAAPAYGITAEVLRVDLARYNPIDLLEPLAKGRVPLFAIHGDDDKVVPLKENSGLLHDRYIALGGSMQLVIPPGQGHNMWRGFFECLALVNFVRDHAGPNLVLGSPLDYQVIQEDARHNGVISIRGHAVELPNSLKIRGRLLLNGKPGKWRKLEIASDGKTFSANWKTPAGGWYRLEVQAISQNEVVAESFVEHVGIGEVFVIAGQSNSANHGAEKQITKTGLVSTFDGNGWQLANDPQPGASGNGGSFIPPFGDMIAERFHVPVGIIACGVGATSVREWLPAGSRFPNPPTLTNQVHQLPNSEWESNGDIFASVVKRMKQLGSNGFRAVLWHQGESDANQADPSRTLPGALYRDYLKKIVLESRREIGWKAPWFIAQASYHTPEDQGSDDIRAAQASLWQDGIALPGPDTDALKGDFRDNSGNGVHFSGPGLREHAKRWLEKVAPWLEKNESLTRPH